MIRGFGLGLRPQHYSAVLQSRPAVDWLEITSENFMAMMRVRGAQAASPSGLAEGFYVSKCVLHG